VTVDDARKAFQSIDPEITQEILDKYIKRGFTTLESNARIETTQLIKRLQSGSIKRIGKKP